MIDKKYDFPAYRRGEKILIQLVQKGGFTMPGHDHYLDSLTLRKTGFSSIPCELFEQHMFVLLDQAGILETTPEEILILVESVLAGTVAFVRPSYPGMARTKNKEPVACYVLVGVKKLEQLLIAKGLVKN